MKIRTYTIAAIALLFMTSCEKIFMDKEPGTSPAEVFEQVWKFTDQNYSFFKYKGIDWGSVHTVYQAKISEDMNEEALFDTLGNMLFLLRDGHVNLSSDFNRSRNWQWFLDYPANYDFDLLQRNYFNNEEQYLGSFTICDFEDVGYVQYHSFMDQVNQDDLDYIFEKFKDAKGLIFDVRNNGGGSLANVYTIANAFTEKEIDAAYEQYKNGPGHEDFGEKSYYTLNPVEDAAKFDKPIIILTNRMCYSATNFLVTLAQALPNVSTMGDNTGGGGGIPTFTELSNGWVVRVSSSRLFTLDGFNTENGIAPDIKVEQTKTDTDNGKDTILEAALELLRNKQTSTSH